MSEAKVCTKCKIEKLLTDFYKAKQNRDRRKSWCKSCEIEYSRQYQKTPKGREVMKRYNQSDKGRKRMREFDKSLAGREKHRRYNSSEKGRLYDKKSKKKHPLKISARNAVNNAIKAGKLPSANTLTCQRCNQQAQEYHHYMGYNPEYNLAVKPYCIQCHRDIDNGN
ncbi:MAG: hypothetical protein ACYSR9_07690 [Planctomycetota bacterium]|jgi:hypothetical protein